MPAIREFTESAGDLEVRGVVHTPDEPSGDGLVLTHGAGANCRSVLLMALADEFCERGFTVLRYDLPFRQIRPHGPPMRGSGARDQQGVRAAVEAMKKMISGRVFAGGHSYGGRQTTIVAAGDAGLVSGLLLLSYPLHPPLKPDQMRTAHFPDLKTSTLFVHGSRDGFGSLNEMTEALKLIPASTKLFPIAGSGHELLSKKNQDEVSKQIVDEFQRAFHATRR